MTENPAQTVTVEEVHAQAGHHEHAMPFLRKYVFSTDHKVIGLQYLFTCLFFFLVGGLLALMVRWEIAWPYNYTTWSKAKKAEHLVQGGTPEAEAQAIVKAEVERSKEAVENAGLLELTAKEHMPRPFLFGAGKLLYFGDDEKAPKVYDKDGVMTPEFYPTAFSMHASVMIFLVIIPLLTGAFGNYLIPLMIGAKDMAFPFLNGLSYWVFFSGSLILTTSFFVPGGASGAGWTGYPPLSSLPQFGFMNGQSLWCVGVIFIGSSSIMGALNYITTIINLRTKGMSLFRMPLTVWSLFITAILQCFATPVLTSALGMLLFDRHMGTSFFLPKGLDISGVPLDVAGGGQVILWQHLFWFYSHPAVYIMILPAMGIVSDVIACYSRKPIFGYKPMVFAISGIAGLGFVVWGHHMFQSGMNPTLGTTFMISTIMIALPSAVKVFNWLGTLWRGQIQFNPAMWYALAFVSMFTIGGLSGIYMASAPVDIFIHDTYYIVAHLHYVLFTGSVMGIFAGIYHWFPKMFGRHLNQFWGNVHFWGTFIFMNGTFFLMHVIGMGGFPRRIGSGLEYKFLDQFHWMNQVMTISAMLLGLFQIPFFVNLVHGIFFGRKVENDNPWHAGSLEWSTVSPPPHLNWKELPTAYHGPYEFSHPNTAEDFAPQWIPIPAAQPAATHEAQV